MRWLVVALVVAACGSSSEQKPGPVKIDSGLRMTYSLDLVGVSDRAAAVKQAVDVTSARLARAKIPANAFARGETLVVDVGALDPEHMEQARELIGRTARFEVRVIAARSPFMDALHEHVSSDARAQSAGIRADDERWKTDDGVHEAYFISAPDRPTLRGYLDELAFSNPTFRVRADHVLGYGQGRAIDGERPRWRAYDVHAAVRLDNAAIRTAKASVDREQDNQPTIELELTDDGARKLAELTRDARGEKVANFIDGRIVSAPIIAAPVTNGRLTLRVDDEAPMLAVQLAAGALPAPMRLETQAEIVGDKLRAMDENGNYIMVPR